MGHCTFCICPGAVEHEETKARVLFVLRMILPQSTSTFTPYIELLVYAVIEMAVDNNKSLLVPASKN